MSEVNSLSIRVKIPERSESYEITIGSGLYERLADLLDIKAFSKIFIISEEHLLKLYADSIQKSIPYKIHEIIIESGESSKKVSSLENIWNQLALNSCDRQSLILNLGGGVIGDLGGFAAACFMRGVTFVQLPTTLLSQIDASVGGKTGINFAGIKNLVGSFQQPKAVVINLDVLNTLPTRDFNSGIAEALKHGLIADAQYWKWIYQSFKRDNKTDLLHLVQRSVEIKSRIVESDEKEVAARKLLNFGHTLGHAYESLALEANLSLFHGEAVALGMLGEARISERRSWISESDLQMIVESLSRFDLLKLSSVKFDFESIKQKIAHDKKSSSGSVSWTLLKSVGEGIINQQVSDDEIKEAISYVERIL